MVDSQETGVPGGWGATKSNDSGSSGSSTTVTTSSDGTYTDAQGRQITREQAMSGGSIDKPGEATQKLASIGGSSRTYVGGGVAPTPVGVEALKAAEKQQATIRASPQQAAQQQAPPITQAQQAQQFNPLEKIHQDLGIKPVVREFQQRQQTDFEKQVFGRPYTPQTQQRIDRSLISEKGFVKTTAAVLSSTELFGKSVEVEARLASERLTGKPAGYDQAVNELREQVANRFREKPSLGKIALESPITAGIPIGAGFKAGGYLARTTLIKTGGVVSKVSPYAGSLISSGQKVIEPALTVGGVAYVGSDVLKSKDIYEASGKIGSYVAMTPGAVYGYNKAAQAISALQTRGLKTIPAESVIKPEVLSGKETFPTTRAGSFKAFKQEFKTPEGKIAGYHATHTSLGKGTTVKGEPIRPLDVPGMYISPYQQGASPAFLRLQGGSGYKISIEQLKTSSALNPEINLIRGITDIERIPGGKNVQTSRQFLYTQSEKNIAKNVQDVSNSILAGTRERTSRQISSASKVDVLNKAYIEPKMELGGFRGEAQAVLAPGTRISGIEKASRIKYKDRYVPVVERSIIVGESTKEPSKTFYPQSQEFGGYFRERQYYEPGSSLKPIILSSGKTAASNISSSVKSSSRNIASSVIEATRQIESSSSTPRSSKAYAPLSSSAIYSKSKPSIPQSSITSVVSRVESPIYSRTPISSDYIIPRETKIPISYFPENFRRSKTKNKKTSIERISENLPTGGSI